MNYQAAIFDMDGLLLESESLWRQAETEAADRLGLPLSVEDFVATMGLRIRDVTGIWYDRFGWASSESPEEVADGITARVIELVGAEAEPLPGVFETLDVVAAAGLKLGLCSSSDRSLIDAAVNALGLVGRFEITHSASHDQFGKPHPGPYLKTAEALAVDPARCLVFEDSVAGVLSAKAAMMTAVAVPAGDMRHDVRFGIADVVLGSLLEVDMELLCQLADGRNIPSLARPRFHLAFPVDSLESARQFYGQLLGCGEGRSADTWVDFNLCGHQIVAHVEPTASGRATKANEVDGKRVPSSHFGVLLPVSAWKQLRDRLQAADAEFLIDPYVRFEGQAGEQHTLFVTDPAGNALEFKAFVDDDQVFAR